MGCMRSRLLPGEAVPESRLFMLEWVTEEQLLTHLQGTLRSVCVHLTGVIEVELNDLLRLPTLP